MAIIINSVQAIAEITISGTFQEQILMNKSGYHM